MNYKFKFHSIDSGFCRVYFVLNPTGDIFCIQQEFKDVYGFYNCSGDGEPIAPFNIKKELKIEIELPPHNCKLSLDSIKFINEHNQLIGVPHERHTLSR